MLHHLQFYSDKTNLTRSAGGISAYPFKAALLNADYKDKVKNIQTLGYIPVLKEDPAISSDTYRAAKRLVLSQCLKIMLEPLMEASRSGMILQAPDGLQYSSFPRMLSYVADDPEQRAVLQLYTSNKCKRPCCR